METQTQQPKRLLVAYLIVFFILWSYTLIGTTDFANWCIENILTVVFLGTLMLTYKKFQFTPVSYTFIFVYILMHIYGAMYTYAENPFGYWLVDTLGLQRNPYDRIVHFSFGFMLAYPMRDYFTHWFKWPIWVCWVLPCEITLSFSGMYELIEWAVADIFFPAQGAAYLGSQGDIWDAQKDMGLAFSGSVIIMLVCYCIERIRNA